VRLAHALSSPRSPLGRLALAAQGRRRLWLLGRGRHLPRDPRLGRREGPPEPRAPSTQAHGPRLGHGRPPRLRRYRDPGGAPPPLHQVVLARALHPREGAPPRPRPRPRSRLPGGGLLPRDPRRGAQGHPQEARALLDPFVPGLRPHALAAGARAPRPARLHGLRERGRSVLRPRLPKRWRAPGCRLLSYRRRLGLGTLSPPLVRGGRYAPPRPPPQYQRARQSRAR